MAGINKRFLNTLIGLGVFVCLAIAVYSVKDVKGGAKAKVRLFSKNINKDDITKFELINKENKENITCEKLVSGEWKMTLPKQYELEKSEIDSILNNLADISIDRKLKEKAEDLKSYGLDSPGVKAVFYLKNGKSYGIETGLKAPTETYYYVKNLTDNDVYTAYTYSVEPFKKSVKDLRKKTIADFETEKMTKLNAKFERKELNFERTPDNKWQIMPYKYSGNKYDIENLAGKVKDLKILEFVEDDAKDLAKYGLDKPRCSVTVSLGVDRPAINVLTGKKRSKDKNEDYAKRSDLPAVYIVSSDFAEAFNKPYNDFRDKDLFSVNSIGINEVEINGAKKIIARRGKDDFLVEEPVKKAVKSVFEDLISGMSSLRAESFVDDSGKNFDKYGLKKPRYTAALFEGEGKDRKLKAKLYIGNEEKDKGNVYVKIEGSDSVYNAGKSILEKVQAVEKALEAK
jgi:hypothetical protein